MLVLRGTEGVYIFHIVQDMMQMGHGGRIMPAIWFRYEMSPITVRYVEKSKPFYTFLVMVSQKKGMINFVCKFVCYLLFNLF